MTLHIDEHVLADVMNAHDIKTKTEAVNFALSELDRLAKLRAYRDHGLGLSEKELKEAFYPDYDPSQCMVAEENLFSKSNKPSK